MDVIQLETIGTELMDIGMVTKSVFDNNEMIGTHAHYPLNNENDKAITVFDNGDMELQTRYGREKFATVRFSREEMHAWLGLDVAD